MDEKLAEMRAPYLAPVSDDAPAGQDARYEPEAEAVRAAIAQLDSPTGEAVDWTEVKKDCTTILQKKGKDFLITSCLAAALYELESLAGLTAGVAVLTGLIDTYWENGFPKKKRVRARANSVGWFISRMDTLVDVPIKATDKQAIDLLEHATKQLVEIVYERFEDSAPALGTLRDNVQRLKLSVPEPEAPKPAPAPQPAQPPPAQPEPQPAQPQPQAAKPAASVAVKTPDAPGEMAGADQVVPFLRDVGASLYKASRELFKANKSSPLCYRLSRLGLYLHMEEPPPTTSGQKTAVPPPTPDVVNQFDTLAKGQKWAALLEEAESSLGRSRFWLDIHRYVALSLGGLGHDAAKEAVIDGTASLLQRMPDVRERQFNTGQPFANAGTQEWFEMEVMPSGGEGGGGGDGLSDEERATMDEARKLSAGGKVDEAIGLLQEVSRSGGNAAVRFKARLAMGQACAASGANGAADGLFTTLLGDIDRYHLEEWDPDLAGKCLAAHCEMLKGMVKKTNPGEKSDPAIAERLAKVYSRLCRVSPSVAYKIGG